MMLYVTDSMLLWVAENVLALRPRLPLDYDDEAHLRLRKLYLYLAILSLLLFSFHHAFFAEKKLRSSLSHIPKYSASKWKWWFGAEDLLKKSYRKVIILYPSNSLQVAS